MGVDVWFQWFLSKDLWSLFRLEKCFKMQVPCQLVYHDVLKSKSTHFWSFITKFIGFEVYKSTLFKKQLLTFTQNQFLYFLILASKFFKTLWTVFIFLQFQPTFILETHFTILCSSVEYYWWFTSNDWNSSKYFDLKSA